ncbi:MAG: oligopeptide transporter permease, partial [Pseudomonadota bacterium]
MTLDQGIMRHIGRRLLGVVPTLLLLITVVFFLVRIAPGGPFDSEKALPPEIQANLEAKYHLDEPLIQQYIRYLGQILVFDFGPSFQYKDWTVNELIAQGFPVSLTIGGIAMLLGFVIGVTIGVGAPRGPKNAADFGPQGHAMQGGAKP